MSTRRTICQNRRARFEFDLDDTLEAGLILQGSEVKSLRQGRASLEDAFVAFEGGKAVLLKCNIPVYAQANRNNHEPTRPRPLLLNSVEIGRLREATREKGLSIVPLEIYFKGPWIKVEITVGRGRKLHDKRAAIRERDDRREAERAKALRVR